MNSDTLDLLLVKITNPLNPVIDGLDVQKFCHLVCKSDDGPQQASKLLAYRIHSPQEKEALYSLMLLDQCVKSCGQGFQSEVGKFRFLNELIKLVSPKYDGSKTPAAVKQKVFELLYTWSLDLPHEPKIKEAYGMLKKQGVVKTDPTYLGVRKLDRISQIEDEHPVPPKQRTPFLGNEEQEKTIKALIQSGRPEDLEKANRLIKSLVQQDERKAEVAAMRACELEKISNNTKILKEMIDGGASSSEERELMQELAETCERLRPSLFKFAAETEGEALDSILRSADELNQVLDTYKEYLKGVSSAPTTLLEIEETSGQSNGQNHAHRISIDDELLSIDLQTTSMPSFPLLKHEPIKPVVSQSSIEKEVSSPPVTKPRGLDSLDVLGDLLKTLPGGGESLAKGKFQPRISEKIPMNQMTKVSLVSQQPAPSFSNRELDLLTGTQTTTAITPLRSKEPILPVGSAVSIEKRNSDSDQRASSSNGSVDEALLIDGLNISKHYEDIGLLDVANDMKESQHSPLCQQTDVTKPTNCDMSIEVKPLGDLEVSLAAVAPGPLSPRIIFDNRNGLTTTLHVAKDRPRPDVSVIVLSTSSRNQSPLSCYTMQAIVSKPCRIKLLPPSSTSLPAYNPFLPPPAITQVLLLATPHWDSVDVKFAVSYELEGETISDIEDVRQLRISP